jgi:hypothetical protein
MVFTMYFLGSLFSLYLVQHRCLCFIS